MDTPVLKIIHSTQISEPFFTHQTEQLNLDSVQEIVTTVKQQGDPALVDYTLKFDSVELTKFEVQSSELKKAERALQKENPELYNALIRSAHLALEFAKKQAECFTNFEVELAPGLITGQKTIPVERAGVYVPAGRFPLFSSVIMGSMPAKAAGVQELILCSPPCKTSTPSTPLVDSKILAVASMCGIDRVFAVGGAQAIAAMAFGTHSIPKVDVIVGPGNKYVAAAKKLVYGTVGIDLVAGPTEVLVIADDTAHPSWVAADLLAQAEHDPDASAILLTTSKKLALLVQEEVQSLVQSLPENAAARTSFSKNSAIIICSNNQELIDIANKKAPEHLELALDPGEQRDMLEKALYNYGSLFIGHKSAEILGDYTAGLNHTLPTSGSARFTGGLSVRHFLKTVTTLRSNEDATANESGYHASLKAAELIAKAEGLLGHALAAKIRL